MSRPTHRMLSALAVALLLPVVPGTVVAQDLLLAPVNRDAVGKVDPLELLQQSADTLASFPQFSATLVASVDFSQGEQKHSQQQVFNVRTAAPNQFSIEMVKPMAEFWVRSDGDHTLTYVEPLGRYALSHAHDGISDFAKSQLGQMVGNGFGRVVFGSLDSESTKLIVSEISDSEYVGEETVGESQQHHARYTSGQMSWDAWFTTGEKPYLVRVQPDMSAIVERMAAMATEPGQQVSFEMDFQLKDVDTETQLQADAFSIKAPAGAQKVKLADLFAPEPEPPHALLARKAPLFDATNPAGEPIDLGELVGDKVIILDFWATWCGPCVAALPKINKVASEYAEKGVAFYAVNQGEDAETVNGFLKQQGLDVPVAMDPEGEAGNLYKVEGLPTSVIIGKDGRVQVVHVGFSEALEEKLREELDALLEGQDLAGKLLDEWNAEHPDNKIERDES